jgi:hypothetical protein
MPNGEHPQPFSFWTYAAPIITLVLGVLGTVGAWLLKRRAAMHAEWREARQDVSAEWRAFAEFMREDSRDKQAKIKELLAKIEELFAMQTDCRERVAVLEGRFGIAPLAGPTEQDAAVLKKDADILARGAEQNTLLIEQQVASLKNKEEEIKTKAPDVKTNSAN